MAIGDEVVLASDPKEVVPVLFTGILTVIYLDSFPIAYVLFLGWRLFGLIMIPCKIRASYRLTLLGP